MSGIPPHYVATSDGGFTHPSKVVGKAPQTHANAPTTHPDTLEGIKTPKRIRQSTKPLLNKLESEFVEHMKVLYPSTKFYPQAIRFALGNGIAYKPDLVTFNWCDRQKVECWEVKGPHAFRGGFENLKVAARTYPDVVWRLVWKEKRQWQEQLVLP